MISLNEFLVKKHAKKELKPFYNPNGPKAGDILIDYNETLWICEDVLHNDGSLEEEDLWYFYADYDSGTMKDEYPDLKDINNAKIEYIVAAKMKNDKRTIACFPYSDDGILSTK